MNALPLFAATLFLSAALLFCVQPMVAKMVLPLLGGAPGVWNAAMMFFQTALLAGYAYAHLVARRLPPAAQAGVHIAVLLAGVAFLPLAVPPGWTPSGDAWPIPFLLGLLTVSVGLPFFAVSATAPLLQAWFARSGHPAAHDPYFLYGASNLGSILALLFYPLLMEPALTVPQQSRYWTLAYALLVALIALCAWRAGNRPLPREEAADETAPPTWRQRLHWVLLAFAPSSLLLGVTTFITTDIASAPLFWVVPLTLYLLSFVVVFARRPILPHRWMVMLQPFVLIPLAIVTSFGGMTKLQLILPLHLLAFFVTALVCHGELVQRRPAARHLTGFYLWMSFGGMLGGVFNALVAPVVFNGVYEYVLALLLAAALRPTLAEGRLRLDLALPVLLLGAMLLPGALGYPLATLELWGKIALFTATGVTVFAFSSRPLRFALGLGVVLAWSFFFADRNVVAQTRSFFGVYKVEDDKAREAWTLVHGTTLHGSQSRDPALRLEPGTYYSRVGPFGDIMRPGREAGHIGAIGLGLGTIACYKRPEDDITFYEIDPAVVRVARDRRWFDILSECGRDARIVLGDARLKLREAPDGAYDVLVVDAFSSDAIPVHLLTREAFELYLRKLAPDGVIALHISNRHLDLAPVAAAIAADLRLAAVMRFDHSTAQEAHSMHRLRSTWIALARLERQLNYLAVLPDWKPLDTSEGARPWTDDYSDIVGALNWWRR